MKKIIAITLAAMALLLTTPSASAWTLRDLLGGLSGNTTNTGDGTGSSIGNFLQGVFSSSDITVADMAGEWTVNGSAVSFRSENFLKKAGGAAAASAIESKLNPYYKQYGLTGGVITIQTDGSFKFQMKKMSLSGTIQQTKEKGVFSFAFKALGGIPIGTMTAYVQKTSSAMDIMFDATKLQSLLNIAAKITGSKLASAAVSILNSYEGICVGFGCSKTGTVEGENNNSGLNGLLNGLFGNGQQQQPATPADNNKQNNKQNNDTEDSNPGQQGITNLLNGLFGGKR